MQRFMKVQPGKNLPASDDAVLELDVDGGMFAVSGVNKKDAMRT